MRDKGRPQPDKANDKEKSFPTGPREPQFQRHPRCHRKAHSQRLHFLAYRDTLHVTYHFSVLGNGQGARGLPERGEEEWVLSALSHRQPWTQLEGD